MKRLIILLIYFVCTSCIPTKIAPKFKNEDYKIMSAKKFQKKLSKEEVFIFPDPKNADEFYTYIDKKYRLNGNNVGFNVEFQLDGQLLYLTYKEVEREDKTLNLGVIATDLVIEKNTGSTILQDAYTSRKGYWYLILSVYDSDKKNCLEDNHPLKSKAIQYLKALKNEYLTTHNYEELLFTKKS
jgi:hypothetical protein